MTGALVSAFVVFGVFVTRGDVHFYAYAFIGIITTVLAGMIASLLTGIPEAGKIEGLTVRSRLGRTQD